MKVTLEIKDPIVYEVVKKMVRRSNDGIEKYGTTLNADNKGFKYFLNQIQIELMDGVNYIERAREELDRNKSDNPWDDMGFVDIVDICPCEKEELKQKCSWGYACNCTNQCLRDVKS